MKKHFISLILISFMLLFMMPVIYSQDVSLGGKIGMDLCSFSNKDYRSEGSEIQRTSFVGLQISFIGKYKFNNLLGLQAELQIIQKGEREEVFNIKENITYNGTMKINYLTLPLLLNVSHHFNQILVYGNIGPYFGLGLNAISVVKGSGKDSYSMKFGKGELRRFDLGFCIGAGGGYKLGPGEVFLDLRYDFGFLDIYSNIEDMGSKYKPACNRNFGISAGYLFTLGEN